MSTHQHPDDCPDEGAPLLRLTVSRGEEDEHGVDMDCRLQAHVHGLDDIELIAIALDRAMRELAQMALERQYVRTHRN